MLQVSVSRAIVHDAMWWALAAVLIFHLLHQTPAPPNRTAHQRPAPSRVPRGEDQTPEGHEKVTPVAFARAAS